jgi:DNA-binding NarL/FixJ family response regulator
MVTHPLQIKILIADRMPIVAEAIANCLKNQGYTITGIARSGEEAVQQAAATHPDVVLIDVQLDGELDGIEAAWQIQSEFACPVIYMAGAIDEATLGRARSTDPYGYLVKPFTLNDLNRRIEVALQKHRADLEMQAWGNEQFLILLSLASKIKPLPRVVFENHTLMIYVRSRGRARKLQQQCADLKLPYRYQILFWEPSLEQYQPFYAG